MQPKFQRFFAIAAIASAVSASGCALHHQHGRGHGHLEGDGLTVLGSGEAKASPDVARTSIGIEVRADTAEQATSEANTRMTAILSALKGAGVADADLRTHDFSVSFERDYTPPQPVVIAPAPKPTKGTPATPAATPAPAPSNVPRGSYRVSNTVEVTVRDVSKVSAVLTAATAAGANNVWGINFDVENPEPLHEKAREQAIAKAKHNAEQLAKLTGVKLGAIVTIEDQADAGQIAPRMYRAAMAESADSSQVPVQGGELTITHQVRLVYALEK
ncbi:MAG: uncharacterized protein JWN48_5272 [Myxococcaceae bacterium]|nr:uncharacterized protein [Myxococcaceae bacterium]